MTEYTAAYSLPCQTGADPPCDAPEVWCDFADGLETALLGFDSVLGRLSPSIPVAEVFIDTPVIMPETSFGLPILWQGISIDTDNMVDFGRSLADIRPTRFGRYAITVDVALTTQVGSFFTPTSVRTVKGTFFVSPLGGSAGVSGGLAEDHIICSTVAPAPFYFHSTAISDWEQEDVDLGLGWFVVHDMHTGAITQTIISARMAVYWISDELGA